MHKLMNCLCYAKCYSNKIEAKTFSWVSCCVSSKESDSIDSKAIFQWTVRVYSCTVHPFDTKCVITQSVEPTYYIGHGWVQLYWYGFESRLRHSAVGKKPRRTTCEANIEIISPQIWKKRTCSKIECPALRRKIKLSDLFADGFYDHIK